jgi:hypothetical protein
MIVGRNPQPTKLSLTLHSALIIPADGVAVRTPNESGVAASTVPTAGCPGATGTAVAGNTIGQFELGNGLEVDLNSPIPALAGKAATTPAAVITKYADIVFLINCL